jgi:Domain of unknown function (DUF4430)
VRTSAVLLLALAVAGCGGAREHGTATLWVTRDRGAHVLYTGTVPAGLTAMQALERKEKVTTRYGGRFVQSIDGVQGSLTRQHDWFYYVNGLEGDRSAAEVRLHDGDVEWWDFRAWNGRSMSVPVVVGAYPEPFRRGTTSVVATAADASIARRIAAQVHGVVDAKKPTKNFIVVSSRFGRDLVRIKRLRSGVLLELGVGAARGLAANGSALRYRYGTAE